MKQEVAEAQMALAQIEKRYSVISLLDSNQYKIDINGKFPKVGDEKFEKFTLNLDQTLAEKIRALVRQAVLEDIKVLSTQVAKVLIIPEDSTDNEESNAG